MIFDEDLREMVFPKIQEIEFRVSKNSPIHIAAKLLAVRNGHMNEWRQYEFSLYSEEYLGNDKTVKSLEIKDWIQKNFSHLLRQ